jgi:hypothetical protein
MRQQTGYPARAAVARRINGKRRDEEEARTLDGRFRFERP